MDVALISTASLLFLLSLIAVVLNALRLRHLLNVVTILIGFVFLATLFLAPRINNAIFHFDGWAGQIAALVLVMGIFCILPAGVGIFVGTLIEKRYRFYLSRYEYHRRFPTARRNT